MALPITNLKLSDIAEALGLSGTLMVGDQLFGSPNVVPSGLDPTYCSTYEQLMFPPYYIGEWRNYNPISVTSLLKGKVTNALTGDPLNLVLITVNTPGTPLTTHTNVYGEYSLAVPAGGWVTTFQKEGFVTHINTLNIPSGVEVEYYISMSPLFMGTRMVLNWGASPTDLDLMLHTPFSWDNGASIDDTVYFPFTARGSATSKPWVTLDKDVVTGYGPETITVHGPQEGYYGLVVKRYSTTDVPLVGSGATITFYNDSSQSLIVNVDEATVVNPGTPLQNIFWYVADIKFFDPNKGIHIVNEIRNVWPF